MPTEPPVAARVAALEADLAFTRARFAQDAAALRSKLTPAGLAEEVGARLQGRPQGSRDTDALYGGAPKESEWWRSVSRSNPALTLLGAGLAWLLLRSSRRTKEV